MRRSLASSEAVLKQRLACEWFILESEVKDSEEAEAGKEGDQVKGTLSSCLSADNWSSVLLKSYAD